jgi:hypothetical protein
VAWPVVLPYAYHQKERTSNYQCFLSLTNKLANEAKKDSNVFYHLQTSPPVNTCVFYHLLKNGGWGEGLFFISRQPLGWNGV